MEKGKKRASIPAKRKRSNSSSSEPSSEEDYLIRLCTLRHTDININTESYNVGYVGVDANGRLNLRIDNNGSI
ncbi:5308_t:CDS:2, partial [Gigaspora rosea]